MLLFPILLLFQTSNAQKVTPLSIFTGGMVDNEILTPPPYSLYVSASMDSKFALDQTFIKTKDGQIKSLTDLKNARVSSLSNRLRPMLIQSTAYISSNLDDSEMRQLKGFLYITTAKQSQDDNFHVFDIAQSEVVQTMPLGCSNCTLVFLNTDTKMSVPYSSTFSSWRQEPESIVKMYKGIPSDEEELNSSQLFSNPIQTIKKSGDLFLPTVEKFSVSLSTFYLKTTGLNFYFVINPYYFDSNDVYSTTGYHSTGFYMKSVSQPAKQVTVLVVRDTRFNGTTGANVVGSFPDQTGKVYVNENDGGSSVGFAVSPANQILGWNVDKIGQNITISSDGSQNGEFFVQYYVYQGEQISSTFAPTKVYMETTTAGGAGMTLLIGMVSVALSKFFHDFSCSKDDCLYKVVAIMIIFI
uniref:IgGFc_binding domain-containing protein n=1 Tax=Caenorhabditis tropicalis TaxID=1561998 RepID=A0A1I7UBH8_9PELO